MHILDLGNRDYKEIWELQKNIHARRVADELPNVLILVEHNPVITVGKSGKPGNVLFPIEALNQRGVALYHIERGGDATYHGPGQLVGYPIFNVRDGLAGIKPFINGIERTIIATLHCFGIEAYTKEKMIGVWTESGKICSIGVAVKKWVSFHGFALNVNTDLNYFDLIVPCGLKNVEMVSMQKILGREIAMDEIKESVVSSFGSIFGQETKRVCLKEVI
ncbi:MAG: lipoyl(octanoyl) transferase LipB [candidate division WOR-3 bacterium]|nr:MAG: lipoyl(octanoyl) transferase LipB [candidate division WOR-3 bacterium]